MTLTGEREHDFPARPGAAGDAPQIVTESGLSWFRRWLRHAPAERVPLVMAPAAWTAADIMHAAGISGLFVGAATGAAALAGGWIGEHRSGYADRERLRGVEVAAITGGAGAWMAMATAWGPLAGPYDLLSVLYLAAAGGGYWWLRRHEAVQAARKRRDAEAAWTAQKSAWHRLAPALGLNGSHLLQYEETLLGDTMLIDTRGTGRRASQISPREVAERLGEIDMIPIGRIDVTTDRIPGRLRISKRTKDPWQHALTHPATDPDSPYVRFTEEPASCRKPLVIGGDPETGDPLRLTLWDEDEGGKVVLIVAKKGSGKTVLLSCISERITACPDAQLLQVNLGKHREDSRWAPLAAANALGRDDLGRARRILQWVTDAIEERSKNGSDSKVQPTPQTPLLVVKIDEVDLVARDPVCKQLLSDIASKCRSEAVALIIAGQRATAQWLGGADLRANVDIAVLGRFARPSEARKATGEEIDLPDMGEYGEGRPGVFLITELGGGGSYERGRVFKLDDPASIEAIVSRRLATRRTYVPEPAFAGLAGEWAQITSAAPCDDGEDSDGPSPRPPSSAGRLVQGTEDIKTKISAARDQAGGDPDLPEIPPEMEDHYARLLAERQRQALEQNYGDVTIPREVISVLLSLLAAPDGITSSQAAEAIGKSKPHAHRYLSALRARGVAQMDGGGRGAKFRLAGETESRPLSLVPPLDEGAACDVQ
jgi:IclR helix-turn-helix domain